LRVAEASIGAVVFRTIPTSSPFLPRQSQKSLSVFERALRGKSTDLTKAKSLRGGVFAHFFDTLCERRFCYVFEKSLSASFFSRGGKWKVFNKSCFGDGESRSKTEKFFRGRRRECSCRTSANRSVDGPMRFIASSHGSDFEQATRRRTIDISPRRKCVRARSFRIFLRDALVRVTYAAAHANVRRDDLKCLMRNEFANSSTFSLTPLSLYPPPPSRFANARWRLKVSFRIHHGAYQGLQHPQARVRPFQTNSL